MAHDGSRLGSPVVPSMGKQLKQKLQKPTTCLHSIDGKKRAKLHFRYFSDFCLFVKENEIWSNL